MILPRKRHEIHPPLPRTSPLLLHSSPRPSHAPSTSSHHSTTPLCPICYLSSSQISDNSSSSPQSSTVAAYPPMPLHYSALTSPTHLCPPQRSHFCHYCSFYSWSRYLSHHSPCSSPPYSSPTSVTTLESLTSARMKCHHYPVHLHPSSQCSFYTLLLALHFLHVCLVPPARPRTLTLCDCGVGELFQQALEKTMVSRSQMTGEGERTQARPCNGNDPKCTRLGTCTPDRYAVGEH